MRHLTIITRGSLAGLVTLLWLVGGVPSAMGQASPRQETLESRVNKLEQVVRDLQKRITDLEDSQKHTQPVPTAKQNWVQLRYGMSAEAVRMLLGTPRHLEATAAEVRWCYAQSCDRGAPASVEFSLWNMTVTGWRAPD